MRRKLLFVAVGILTVSVAVAVFTDKEPSRETRSEDVPCIYHYGTCVSPESLASQANFSVFR